MLLRAYPLLLPSLGIRVCGRRLSTLESLDNVCVITFQANFLYWMYVIFQSPSDGTDYEGLRLSVTFPASSSQVSFNVVIHDNQAHSCPVDFFLDLEIPSAASAMGVVKASPGNATVLIADEHSGECCARAVYCIWQYTTICSILFCTNQCE